jgi:MFS family permease
MIRFKEVQNLFLYTRIMQAFFIATVPVSILLSILLPRFGFELIYSNNYIIFQVGLCIGSLICFLIGLFWPRLFGWHQLEGTDEDMEREIIVSQGFRLSFFEPIVFFGFVLAISGSCYYIWLPLFALACIPLILTFPTDKKVAKWLRSKSHPHENADS